jgi:hypothetical protein
VKEKPKLRKIKDLHEQPFSGGLLVEQTGEIPSPSLGTRARVPGVRNRWHTKISVRKTCITKIQQLIIFNIFVTII